MSTVLLELRKTILVLKKKYFFVIIIMIGFTIFQKYTLSVDKCDVSFISRYLRRLVISRNFSLIHNVEASLSGMLLKPPPRIQPPQE